MLILVLGPEIFSEKIYEIFVRFVRHRSFRPLSCLTWRVFLIVRKKVLTMGVTHVMM